MPISQVPVLSPRSQQPLHFAPLSQLAWHRPLVGSHALPFGQSAAVAHAQNRPGVTHALPMQLAHVPPSPPQLPGIVPGLHMLPPPQHPLQSAPAQLVWHCLVTVLQA